VVLDRRARALRALHERVADRDAHAGDDARAFFLVERLEPSHATRGTEDDALPDPLPSEIDAAPEGDPRIVGQGDRDARGERGERSREPLAEREEPIGELDAEPFDLASEPARLDTRSCAPSRRAP
jgi:hypothetical protein